MIAVVRNADCLIILGPDEAKGELKRRLVKNKLGARISAVEAMDYATDRQIAAKVRGYFSGTWSPKGPRAGRPNAGPRGKTPPTIPRLESWRGRHGTRDRDWLPYRVATVHRRRSRSVIASPTAQVVLTYSDVGATEVSALAGFNEWLAAIGTSGLRLDIK